MVHSLLIKNCSVLQCDGRKIRILESHDILIEANKIKGLAPAGTISAENSIRVLDSGGMLAMPGLINTHAHVPMVIFRGLAEDVHLETWFNDYMWPLERNLQPEDVYWGMLLGSIEMIEAGVTSVADHYFHMDHAAKAVEESGMRAALGWAVFGNQGEAMLEKTARFAEEYNGSAQGRITTWMAPHAPYTCDEDFLGKAARWAKKLGIGIHIHAAETREQTARSIQKTGATPIEALEKAGIFENPTIVAHACGATDSDLAILRKYPAGIAHSPKTYLKLAMGVAPVIKFLDAGIPVGLATDGVVSNNTLDIWESMRLTALLQKHETCSPESMTLLDTLHLATLGSASVYGMADSIGQIQPGFLADIILVDMSGAHNQPLHDIPANLVYSTRASDVQTVIIDGKIIMENRNILTVDKAEVISQVRQSMERLAQRVPERRIQKY
jgi:5-methylthioadenosine/S-adenosylhomocysteine deaminase